MGALVQPITVEEFLAWEAGQAERFEFDGTQPVAMTGASFQHAMVVTRLIGALLPRLRRGCVPVANDLKVVTERRVRYPDLAIVCGPVARDADQVAPTVVMEVLSPSTALTDQRVKPVDYASVASIMTYVTWEQDSARATVRRRSTGSAAEVLEGAGAMLALPEVGIELPVSEIYPD
jgi:Uma2 family endonuclease